MRRHAFCGFLTAVFLVIFVSSGFGAPGYPQAEVARQGKKAVLTINSPGSWKLLAADRPDTAHSGAALATGSGPGKRELALDTEKRLYFYLEQEGGLPLVLAEQRLPVRGGYNFRDLGGIQTRDGRITAYGKLIRSDDLADLHPEGLAYLASVPLATIVDFRTGQEVERKPDQVPASVRQMLHLAINPGRLDRAMDPAATRTREDWEGFMRDMNRALVLDEENVAVYREFFQLVQNQSALPLLFHCSAGKDRTGLAAALILFSLGVDKESVMRDYLASAVYLQGKYDKQLKSHPERAPLFTVDARFLQAAIDAMEQKSGNVQMYLTNVLGVDIERMRALFLQ